MLEVHRRGNHISAAAEALHTWGQGTLMIATTHTYARYVLPRVVSKFVERYPSVRLGLQQGNPTQICEAVDTGEADLAVGTEAMRPFPGLVMLPCFPIARSGRWRVTEALHKQGIEPNVIFGAVDADVCKTYVELGLGIAILATVAVDPKHDAELKARDASHLFESSTTYVSLRANSYLRSYLLDFIGVLAPELTPELVRAGVEAGRTKESKGRT